MGTLSDRQKDRLVGYALLLLTVASLYRVAGNLFLLADDPQYVVLNEHVRRGLSWAGAAWAFRTTAYLNWHPAAWLSHMLDVELFGLNPAGHHLVSLAIHVANTLLLFGILRRATGARAPSAFVAAVFAVHPLHVESVAWVAERKDVLYALFWLLALRAYVRYAERPGAARYGAVALFFALGLLSKAMAVTLPFVLLVLDWWPLGRTARTPAAALVAEKLPLVAMSAGAALVAYMAQAGGGAVNPIPPGMRLANALTAYAGYAAKTLWPHPLAIYYPHPGDIGASIPAWKVAAACLFLVGFSAGAVALAKRRPGVMAGWLWFLGTLVPVIGIVQVGGQAMADRYMYVPIVGLAAAAAWGLPPPGPGRPIRARALAAAAAAAIVALAVASWRQSRLWHDTVTVLEHALSVTSGSWWAERHLGNTYEELGAFDNAATHYRNALRISPRSAIVLKDVGRLLMKQGQPREAAAVLRKVVESRPDDLEARLGLAAAFEGAGMPEEARRQDAEALRLAPGLGESKCREGVALLRIGRPREALEAFRAAVRLSPGNAEAHNALGVVLGEMGRTDEAAAQFREALRLRPDFAEARSNLAGAAAGGAGPR